MFVHEIVLFTSPFIRPFIDLNHGLRGIRETSYIGYVLFRHRIERIETDR